MSADREADRACDDYEAADPLGAAGLRDLPPGAPLVDVEAALRRLGASLNGADPLARLALREDTIRELRRAGVTRPAQLADAVFGVDSAKKDVQGRKAALKDPEPWPEPVDGAELLDRMVEQLTRHVVAPVGAPELVALWCVHTFLMDCWEATGYLAIVSPVKGCGKTTCLTLVRLLSRRGQEADSITPASLFRFIEATAPTLVLDELDGLDRDSDVWTILNSGHRRGGGALRCEGESNEARVFTTWCAKALGYIRPAKSPVRDTVEDRSIFITLARKRADEPREKLRTRVIEAQCAELRRRCMRWADDNREDLAAARPEPPGELDDRAADCWEPLLAVADAVGGRWPQLARQLAVQLSTERREDEGDGVEVLLLLDLADLLDSGRLEPDGLGLAAEDMIHALCALPDRPWARWPLGKGSGITAHAIARRLRRFGVRPAKVPGGRGIRRYVAADILSASGRFREKRQSATEPGGHTVSDSPDEAWRYGASEAPPTRGGASGVGSDPPAVAEADPTACPSCGADSCDGSCPPRVGGTDRWEDV